MTNAYRLLLNLLPARPLQVGTVTSVSSGVYSITLPGGGVATARGTDVSVGSKVFFRDNVIEGPAPNLPVENIEV